MPGVYTMHHFLRYSVLIFCLAVNMAMGAEPLQRIVCLGDSITDEGTYPQIITQALREAGETPPIMINAGVVIDTMAKMRDRLDSSVLIFHPQVVTVLAGANDAMREVSPQLYDEALRDIIRRVKAAGGSVLLCTPCPINARNAETPNEKAESFITAYIEVIRTVAREEGLAVAEVNARLSEARTAGLTVLAPDGVHPNYAGKALIARAMLDALGKQHIALPALFKPKPFPGLLRSWQVRPAPADAAGKVLPLATDTIIELAPGEGWQSLHLPMALQIDPLTQEPFPSGDLMQQLRMNGFAVNLPTLFDKAAHLHMFATITRTAPGEAYLHIGGDLAALWLNGERIAIPDTDDLGKPRITGFHAGRARIPLHLKAGENKLLVDKPGTIFFLSITDTLIWEAEVDDVE